jgi:hypothetical protein
VRRWRLAPHIPCRSLGCWAFRRSPHHACRRDIVQDLAKAFIDAATARTWRGTTRRSFADRRLGLARGLALHICDRGLPLGKVLRRTFHLREQVEPRMRPVKQIPGGTAAGRRTSACAQTAQWCARHALGAQRVLAGLGDLPPDMVA